MGLQTAPLSSVSISENILGDLAISMASRGNKRDAAQQLIPPAAH